MLRTFATFSLLGLTAAASSLVAPVMALPHTVVPPNSFINYHAATVSDLSQEVSLDPAVRVRLAHHFHVTPAQMKTYVSQNLVLTRLKSANSYRVACVRPDGSEYWVQERLPAGTPVFASRATGQPILKLACGNPMVSALPATTKIAESRTQYTKPRLAAVPSTLATPTSAAPVLVADAAPQFAFASDALPASPVVQVAGSLESLPLRGGGGGFPLGYLASIPVLAGIIGSGHGSNGGGGTPDVPIIPIIPIIPIAPAVPETSTVVSLGLLLTATSLVLLRRKRPAQD